MTNHVKVYEKYTSGRSFFTTDIHGHFDLLHEQMKLHAFDTSKDRLYVGGDSTDRHSDSKYILDYINEPWFISVQGNHCTMLIDAYENPNDRNAYEMLYFNGGQWYYDLEPEHQKQIYESYKSLPVAIEVETSLGKVGIVHAQCPYNDWNKFKEMTDSELAWNGKATLQWARSNYDRKYDDIIKGVDVLLVGHSPTRSGDIEKAGNTWYCDLGSFFRGRLSFIEIT